MRQAGILAAAGIYALNHNIERLQIDHDHAKRLAKALSLIPGLSVDLDRVQTNLILIHSEGPAKELVSRFESIGVACFDTGPNTVRWVIHGDVTAEQVETVMERLSPWKS